MLIDAVPELSPFIPAWRALAEDAPMSSPEWLLAWWEVYAKPKDRLSLLLFHKSEGSLVGLAPLFLEDAEGKATYRILGVADDVTHHATWLAAPGWEDRIGKEVARYLLGCESSWKRLLFEAVDDEAEAVYATVRHLADNGLLHHRRQINSCWRIDLPSTWDEYLQTLSKSLRKRCRKLQRQFFDSGIMTLRQAETEAELNEGFEILLKLHSARWGSAEKPLGAFDDDKFHRFHQKVARTMLTRNQLRLAWLEYGDKPVAIEYQFFDDNTVYAYQAGVDLSVNDECSPGKLTMMAAIRFAIEHGCKWFDLLRGNDPYKANWRAVPRPCHDLRVWSRRSPGRMEWFLWNGYTMAVRYLKPVLPEKLVHRTLLLLRGMKKS